MHLAKYTSFERSGSLTGPIAICLLAVTILFSLGILPLLAAIRANSIPVSVPAIQSADVVNASVPISFTLLGAVILIRSSNPIIGWLLLLEGSLTALIDFAGTYNTYLLLVQPQAGQALVPFMAWVNDLSMVNLALFFSFPFFFPNPQPLSKRWETYSRMLIATWGALIFLNAFSKRTFANSTSGIAYAIDNPFAFLPAIHEDVLGLFFAALLLISLVSGVEVLFSSFRTANSETRQQIKWIVYFFALVMLTLLGSFISAVLSDLFPGYVLLDLDEAIPIPSQLFTFGFLIATGFAIFKYRLWDIDLIVNRTVVYGLLTVLLMAAHILIVVGTGALLPQSDNRLLYLVAAGIVAVLFNPLRQHLQQAVNRRMFGQKHDPYTTLSNLSRQLATPSMPEDVLQQVVDTIAAALKLSYVAIQLKQNGIYETAATSGSATTETIGFPLIHQNQVIGRLVASLTAEKELRDIDRELLEVIALQVSVVAQSVRLNEALQISRRRLVTTLEEERRRLRRDLHDGLGPTLASQTLKLDTAIDLIPTNPAAAIRHLENLKRTSKSLIADIRILVQGLRPPALDDLGLVGAVQIHIDQLQRSTEELKISFVTPPEGLPPLSAALESAAYFITLEALNNVVHHAQAQTCYVVIACKMNPRGQLEIRIVDDGAGLPGTIRRGIGLSSMQERAHELDGQFLVEAGPQGGTKVIVQLPLPQGIRHE